MEKRTDRLTAVYVNLAINVVGSHGLAASVRALLECGTPSSVIERVIVNGGPRRGGNGILPK
jgi:hypothetical protein